MSKQELTPTLKDLVAVAEEHGWTVEIEHKEHSPTSRAIYVRFVKGYDRMTVFGSYHEFISNRWRHGALQHYMTLKPQRITLRQLRSRLRH